MTIVAIVPAFDSAATIGATVKALTAIVDVDEVMVIDDGSADDTSSVAKTAGARVIRLDVNRGKGGAVAEGMAAADGADVVLFVDADTGSTAVEAKALLGPILNDTADMTIAVLPEAGGRGGFGLVRGVAREALRLETGCLYDAPLSGQRAIRAGYLTGVQIAPRFGMEVGLTIDLHRAGARITEVSTEFDHGHTGRSLAGFTHRAKQGRDLMLALVSRTGWLRSARSVLGSMRNLRTL